MRRCTAFSALLMSALTALVLTAAPPALAAEGWLGVSTQSLDRDLRDALDLRGDGVLVTRVVDGSPADRAGIRKGDVIRTFNSRTVDSPSSLRDFVRDAGSDRSVAVRVIRDGRTRTFDVRLGSVGDDDSGYAPRAPEAPRAPRAPRAAPAPSPRSDRHIEIWKDGKRVDPEDMPELKHLDGLKGLEGLGDLRIFSDRPELKKMLKDGDMDRMRIFTDTEGRGRLGVQIQDMSDDLADAMGLSERSGVFVLEVLEDTPASRAGMRAGDVILSVDGDRVANGSELREKISGSDGRVRIEVSRRGSRRTIEADLGDSGGSGDSRQRWEWKSDDSSDDDKGDVRRRVFRIAPDARRESSSRDDDRDSLRRELEQLRQELRELREQLRDERDR